MSAAGTGATAGKLAVNGASVRPDGNGVSGATAEIIATTAIVAIIIDTDRARPSPRREGLSHMAR